MRIIRSLLFLSAIFVSACMEREEILVDCQASRALYDETCANYDPCAASSPMSADMNIQLGLFGMEERFDTIIRISFSPTDTLSPGNYIFYAEDDADEYLWTFPDANLERDTREFDLRFDEAVGNSSVFIRLETRVEDSKNCLAESNRSAVSTRMLHFGEFNLSSPFRGTYLGRHCGTNEEFREINLVEGYFPGEEYFTNFPYECTMELNDPRLVSVVISGRKFLLISNEDEDSNVCGQPVGTGAFSADGGQMSFTYRHTFQDGTYEERCWRGNKI